MLTSLIFSQFILPFWLGVPQWSPDSKQDSTPGKDAFFVYEVLSMDDHWRTEEAHYYMVNESDEHPGRPIGYVPV
ncbi:MAG: hypothetical protein HQM16_06100 [Deltaproteobacteria bacterium]|nr:hypothetical protein [Deltaproteobacteria bacterium]